MSEIADELRRRAEECSSAYDGEDIGWVLMRPSQLKEAAAHIEQLEALAVPEGCVPLSVMFDDGRVACLLRDGDGWRCDEGYRDGRRYPTKPTWQEAIAAAEAEGGET